MKTVMLVLVLLFGVAVVVTDQCEITDITKCSLKYASDASAAGGDLSKQCQARRAYVDCLNRAGCSGNAAFTAAKTEMSALCGDGTMVTASVTLILVSLFFGLFK